MTLVQIVALYVRADRISFAASSDKVGNPFLHRLMPWRTDGTAQKGEQQRTLGRNRRFRLYDRYGEALAL